MACHTVTFFYTLPLKRSRRSWCFSGILQTTLFLLFALPHFADFSGGIEPFLADAFRSEDVDVSALGEEPHEDAFAKDVSADAPAAVVALSRFRGGQPVEDSFQGEAFVNEFEVDLFPRVHELDAVLEFSFAEAVDIGLFEGLFCVDDACHAVQAVDLERAGGAGLDASVRTGGDVEIEFGEQDAERTGGVRAAGLCADFFIIECNDVVLVDGARDLPEKVHVRILVIGLCVFEEFVLDVLIDLCPFFGGGQVLQKALKKSFHLYFMEGFARKEDLTDGEELSAREIFTAFIDHLVDAFFAAVNEPAMDAVAFFQSGKAAADICEVAADGPLIDLELGGNLFSRDAAATYQYIP